ncbi:MAG: hypothetical protein KF867_08135 [Cryobacterium sp.]|nr:hypothetical protein [Cryobacterium sp.]
MNRDRLLRDHPFRVASESILNRGVEGFKAGGGATDLLSVAPTREDWDNADFDAPYLEVGIKQPCGDCQPSGDARPDPTREEDA